MTTKLIHHNNKKAFTITELLVAIALLAGIMVGSGLVFSKAVETQQISSATSEITQKYQAICRQLDNDFHGLRKDGEIFLMWVPVWDPELERYVRQDRIMFFAIGGNNYKTYEEQGYPDTNPNRKLIEGKNARITYMIGRNSTVNDPAYIDNEQRILARTQHIYTPDITLGPIPAVPFAADDFKARNQRYEYQTITMNDWMNYDFETKIDFMYLTMTGQGFSFEDGSGNRLGTVPEADGDMSYVDKSDPDTYHSILCGGVSEFAIQSWYAPEQRWFPETDFNGNGIFYEDADGDGTLETDTDFLPKSETDLEQHLYNTDPDAGFFIAESFGMWYPYDYFEPEHNSIGGMWDNKRVFPFNETNFDNIPGLGKAFKFTFTIHDSGGVFPDGKTFSHIVYID